MQRALRITPIRKPVAIETRDTVEMEGKLYREHIYGKTSGKDEKTGLTIVERVVGFHRIARGNGDTYGKRGGERDYKGPQYNRHCRWGVHESAEQFLAKLCAVDLEETNVFKMVTDDLDDDFADAEAEYRAWCEDGRSDAEAEYRVQSVSERSEDAEYFQDDWYDEEYEAYFDQCEAEEASSEASSEASEDEALRPFTDIKVDEDDLVDVDNDSELYWQRISANASECNGGWMRRPRHDRKRAFYGPSRFKGLKRIRPTAPRRDAA